MTKRKLIQKLQQHTDHNKGNAKEIEQELLLLKTSNSKNIYLKLAQKYNHIK